MARTAIVFHIFISSVAVGVLVLITMLIPALQPDLGRWIAIAVIVGFVGSAPISLMAAKAASKTFA